MLLLRVVRMMVITQNIILLGYIILRFIMLRIIMLVNWMDRQTDGQTDVRTISRTNFSTIKILIIQI
jgi:hypothetical protein